MTRIQVRGWRAAAVTGAAVFVLVGVGARVGVWACGPYHRSWTLDQKDAVVLTARHVDFGLEVGRLLPKDESHFAAVLPDDGRVYRQTADAGRVDLRNAMADAGFDRDTAERIEREYGLLRKTLRAYAEKCYEVDQWGGDRPELELAGVGVPQGLPPEFAEYLHGAVAYHRGDMKTAREHWQRLLARPAEQRRYRTVWAAYMLGRSLVSDDPAAAVKHLRSVRELAEPGAHDVDFGDSIGLAAASFGWEARAEMNRGAYDRALRLYLQHWQAGHEEGLRSLPHVVGSMLYVAHPGGLEERHGVAPTPDDVNREQGAVAAMKRCAEDPVARVIVTAYLNSHAARREMWYLGFGDREMEHGTRLWLAALEKHGGDGVHGCDVMAWTAYRVGDFDAAARWAEQADDGSVIARWVKAKLALRAGEIDTGAALLDGVMRDLPAELTWQGDSDATGWVWGEIRPRQVAAEELGALRLGRGEFGAAIDLFLRSERWGAAAYVGEWLLTVDELKRYVDSLPAPTSRVRGEEDLSWSDWRAMWWPRELLARRLVRLGRYDDARPYLDGDHAELLDEWRKLVARGRNEAEPAHERADALWDAARLVAGRGGPLLDVASQPAYHAEDRQHWYEQRPARLRMAQLAAEREADPDTRAALSAPLTGPTTGEAARLHEHAGEFLPRQQRPWIAAELAWEAAQLMTDEHPDLARRLTVGGSWIKVRDPKSAERFYHALVTRCGDHDLAQRARELKWFPVLYDDPDFMVK